MLLATIQHTNGVLLLNHVFAYVVAHLGSNNSSRQEWVTEICQEFFALPI
jgi:hypothetical protein